MDHRAPTPIPPGFSTSREPPPEGFLEFERDERGRLKAAVLMVEKNAMSEEQESVCFTCGLTTGGTLRLNCLPSGQVCPTCRDRLLECLPPIFPAEDSMENETEEASFAEDEAETTAGPQLSPRGPGQLLHGDGPNEPA